MKKLTHEDAEQKLLEKGIEVKMVGDFVNRKAKMKFKCICGKIFESTYASVIQGAQCGCKTDFIGKKYGCVTVLEKTNEKKYDRPLYKCQCDCGKEFLCGIAMLASGDRTSCGCQRKSNIEGLRSGRLVAIKNTNTKDNQGNYLWECKCDCGNTTNVAATYLTSQKTQSCGCVREEKSHLPKFSKDYSGQTFDYLYIKEKLMEKTSYGDYLYLCECKCGKTIKTTASMLISGDRTSCGCKKREDLTNKRFGRLLVIKYVDNEDGYPRWSCRCNCGTEKIIESRYLLSGSTNSCGCLARELSSKRRIKDITGLRSGKLVAIKMCEERDNGGGCFWECQCDCGRTNNVRTSDLTSKNIQSCGNCGLFINGVRCSRPQLELRRILGRGIINYRSRCGLIPDIAFVHNGQKIAVEYDEEYWHDKEEDKVKTKRLIKDGWKVIRVLGSNIKINSSIRDFVIESLMNKQKYNIIYKKRN